MFSFWQSDRWYHNLFVFHGTTQTGTQIAQVHVLCNVMKFTLYVEQTNHTTLVNCFRNKHLLEKCIYNVYYNVYNVLPPPFYIAKIHHNFGVILFQYWLEWVFSFKVDHYNLNNWVENEGKWKICKQQLFRVRIKFTSKLFLYL